MFRRLHPRTTRTVLLGLAACSIVFGGSYPAGEASVLLQTAPSLGAASSFAVLGSSTVTNTGATTVTGDLGVSPGSAVTGFPPGTIVGGTIHAADALAAQAQAATTTAYNSLAGQPCTADLTGQDLGGMTLTPGVYCFSSTAQLTGALTLNAQGNASAVFVFKIGSTLTTASGSSVLLINGGSPCNVFWQVGSSATLGTTTTFLGNILALTSITLNNGASLVPGRALARNGAVTLDTNTVSLAGCSAGVATATATATPTLPPATATAVIAATATLPPAPESAVPAATATAVPAATATAIATLPPATQTAVIAATSTAVTAATATAIAMLPPATQTAVIAATSTAVTAATATAAAAAGQESVPCVGNIRGSKVDGAGQGLPGWTIQLLRGNDTVNTTETDHNGNFDFLGLDMGAYTVEEVQQAGWTAQGQSSVAVSLIACGQNLTGYGFVNVQPAGAPTTTPTAPATPTSIMATPPVELSTSRLPPGLPRTGAGLPPTGLFSLLLGGLAVAVPLGMAVATIVRRARK